MIIKNIPQKLNIAALYYMLTINSIVLIIIAIVAGIFLQMYAPWINTLGAVAVVIFIVALPTFLYTFFYWKLFEYVISDDAIMIKSGVIVRGEKSVNFNDIQNAQASYGPITALLGIKKLKAFTASPSQISVVSNGQGGTTTTVTPDVNIILLKAEAEELLKIMRHGDIQKVQVN